MGKIRGDFLDILDLWISEKIIKYIIKYGYF